MASVGSGVQAACRGLQAELAKLARTSRRSAFFGASEAELYWDGATLRRRGSDAGMDYAQLAAAHTGPEPIVATATGGRGEEAGKYSMHAFGAVFAEVAIDPDVYTMQVRRLVGALVEVGAGTLPVEKFAALVDAPGRAAIDPGAFDPAAATAPPSGLFLERVVYPGEPVPGRLGAITPVP